MVTLLGKKPQVSRHRKCRRIALVDVTDVRNELAQKFHDHRSCWSWRASGLGTFGRAQRRVTRFLLDAELVGLVAAEVFDRTRRG